MPSQDSGAARESSGAASVSEACIHKACSLLHGPSYSYLFRAILLRILGNLIRKVNSSIFCPSCFDTGQTMCVRGQNRLHIRSTFYLVRTSNDSPTSDARFCGSFFLFFPSYVSPIVFSLAARADRIFPPRMSLHATRFVFFFSFFFLYSLAKNFV